VRVLRALVRRMLLGVGVDVRLVRNVEAERHRLVGEAWHKAWRFLGDRSVRTVIDVGANGGQFAMMVHEICPAARILSFEPLPDCFRDLETTCDRIPGAKAFNVALGASSGTALLNRSAFSPSSSLLPMASRHKALWPKTAEQRPVEVRVCRLDDAIAGIDLEGPVVAKIDVQGFEHRVIEGGERTLAAADIVVVEVAYETLYEGQARFDDLYSALRRLGFEFRGHIEQFVDDRTGRIVFADALFEKPGVHTECDAGRELVRR